MELFMEKKLMNWDEFLKEGNNYYLKGRNWSINKKFNNDLIYNLILISIEKNIMAICMKNNYLPENHTITDLICAVKKIISLDEQLEKNLLEIEKYQFICTMIDYNRDIGQIKDINLVINTGHEVNEIAKKITLQ
jgi:hypothetical protein